MEEATDGLRKAAPGWSLAGDRQLLDLLQDMHQKILEKCQDTNKQLDCMVSALDDASVTLQNVNNRFTALSNVQFVESRVYDDDITESPAPELAKEPPSPIPELDIESANQSLLVLNRMHETITILCDSGSGSGSGSGSDSGEEGGSVVLKPKDLYAARPLPYIIGSQQWKSKWHAGLVREDSDMESEEECDKEVRVQYSESESESGRLSPAMSSFSLDSHSHNQHSEMAFGSNPAPAPTTTELPKTQSDIAAELARRLGGNAKVPAVEPDDPEPQPVQRKLYKPHQPTPGNIFSDEPPPLDDQSEESDHDIFAEIYKTSSNSHGDKDQVSVADDLFGKPIFDEQLPPSNEFQRPVINKESSKSINNNQIERESVEKEDVSHKKPIGGKSLFGSNATAQSIGAAILKRNSHQSSTSGDESDHETPHMATPTQTTVKNNENVSSKVQDEFKNKQRDIFDELFAKSERVNKELDRKQRNETKTPEKIVKKVDLFSDNIFDDIDDIFTSNVSKNVIEKTVKEKIPSKSIFDDEDDDLFADVAINKKLAKDDSKKVIEKTDDIFDSKHKETTVTQVDKNIVKDKPISNLIKESKGLFDDSDDDLFTDFNKTKNTQPEQSKTKIKSIKTDDLFSDEDNLFLSKNQTSETKKNTPKLIINETEPKDFGDMKTKKFVQSPDLFDDDISDTMSPEHDTTIDNTKNTLLPNISTTKHNEQVPTAVHIVKQDIEATLPEDTSKTDTNKDTGAFKKESVPPKTETKRNVFDNDSDDDLFGKPSTTKHNEKAPIDVNIVKQDIEARLAEETSKTDKNKDTGAFKKESVLPKTETKDNVFDNDSDDDLFGKPSTTKQNEQAPIAVNLVKQDIEARLAEDTSKTDTNKDTVAFNKESVLPKTETKGNVFDNDSDDDLFGKPLKFDQVTPKNQTLRESHITKDTTENISEVVIDIADKHETSKPSDEINVTTKAVIDEAITGTDSNTVINTEMISGNVSGNVGVTLSKPKISVKPSVQHAEVSQQSTDKTNSLKTTEKIEDQKDTSPDIFADETKSPFSKPMPESKKDVNSLFTDIFNDQPPDFEKPKEPKRSKNVNALFDDDSDDESLFFKKSDVVTDYPTEEVATDDDKLFGLFRDEPPAIDVDFVQKPNKKENVESKTNKSERKTSDLIKTSIFNDDDDELFAPKIDFDKPSKIVDKLNESDEFGNSFSSEASGRESKTSKIKNLFETDAQNKTQDTLDSPQESKKIGKLKPMNFNINVNTLLPVASPKKTMKKNVKEKNNADNDSIQSIDKDFETPTEEVDIPDNIATNMVKSVSFEGEPDSAVLNNKLSKERAKIQVKRRPSTRRARREAVKKSGIDFGEDSTDNSTSIDDSKSESPNTVDTNTETSENEQKILMNKQEQVAQSSIGKQTTSNTNNVKEDVLDRTEKKDSKLNIYDLLDDSTETVQDVTDYTPKVTEVAKNDKATYTKTQSNKETEIKSKIVYVLNDDDIFNTNSLKKDLNEQKKTIFDDLNDEDDIFKTISVTKESKNIDNILEQPKLTSANFNEPMNKNEIFGDDSDSDDLFKIKSKPVVAGIEKTKAAKSEKVEDLFETLSSSGRNTTNIDTKTAEYEKTKDLPEKIAKPEKILLSDSDDEALFKNISATSQNITKTKEDLKDTFKTDNLKDTSKTNVRISDDEENLFRTIPKSVASQDTNTKNKILFDTDEDLFRKSSKKVEKDSKASLFGSDSDDDLFSGNKKEKTQPNKKKDLVFEKRKEVKKVDKKTSLFGDEGDDDDLFGAKKKTTESKPRISLTRDPPKDTSSIKPKAVLEDPLSMFGDED